MAIPYTRTTTALSLVIDFRPHVIPSSHPNFDKIAELVTKADTTEADIVNLIDIPKAINTFTGGNVTVVDGRLFYKGFEVKNSLATVILNFVKAGQAEAAKPFELFMEKAFQNPDPRAVEGLYDWVVAGGLPITPEGDILAWKAVGADYFSIRSGPRGKLRHQIGDVVEEPRHETDANPDQTCSRGVHFCSVEYLNKGGYASGGSRIMAVSISPTDVVAFPRDYNLSKGRCCKLTVVGEVPMSEVPGYYSRGEQASPVYSGWAPVGDDSFDVGEKWRRRDGSVVTIATVDGVGDYPITDDCGNRYTEEGYYNSEDSESAFDLVEYLG